MKLLDMALSRVRLERLISLLTTAAVVVSTACLMLVMHLQLQSDAERKAIDKQMLSLRIGAELPYMEYRWLYAIDIFRFPDGDVLLDRVALFSADTDGRFTREAEKVGQDWKIADLGGLLLTNPGHQAQDYFLAPALPGSGWTLKLAFTRYPPPIRR